MKNSFSLRESNIVKGIAIILMLFHHLFWDTGDYEAYRISFGMFSMEQVSAAAVAAKVCVCCFVFVSGYGLTKKYQKIFGTKEASVKDIFHFCFSRIMNLYGVYWFVYVVCLIGQPLGRDVISVYGTAPALFAVSAVLDIFGLSYLFNTPSMNPTWWYISAALFFILLTPFLCELAKRLGMLLTSLLIAGGILFLVPDMQMSLMLPSFLAGALMADRGCFEVLSKWSSGKKAVLAMLSLLGAAAALPVRNTTLLNGYTDFIFVCCLSVFVFLCVTRIPVVGSVLEFLGKHSIHIFLYHTMLYLYYFKDRIYGIGHWWLSLLVLVLISLAAALLLEFLERKSGYLLWIHRVGERLEIKLTAGMK